MITMGTNPRLPEEEVIDFDKRLRCPVCRGTVQRQEIAAVNGWRRIEIYCTGLECTFRQIVGISITGELRTFDGEEDVPPPAKRKLKPGERRPGAITCAAAGCDKPIVAKRLCQTHYYRWGELGKPGGDERLAWLEAGGPRVRDWKPPEAPEAPEAPESPEAPEAPEAPEPAERAESPKPPAAAPKSPAKAARPPQRPHGPPAEGSTEPPAKPRRPPEAPTTPATAAPAPSEPPAPPEPRPPEGPEPAPTPAPPLPHAHRRASSGTGQTSGGQERRRTAELPSSAAGPTSGGGWRERFIVFREATELLRLDLPRGTSEIVLVRTGQFLTIGRLDGLVLGQIPIAEMH